MGQLLWLLAFLILPNVMASPNYGEEERFLTDLGLDDFVTIFQEEDLTMDLMVQLREDQLRELGLRMGQRMRFVNAA